MPKPEKVVIHWFRQDLRLSDNPALYHAAKAGTVIPIYILDEVNCGDRAMGGASKWWLHHSLEALNESLGGKLSVYKGCPHQILPELVKKFGVDNVFWNRCYEPWRIKRDKKLKEALQSENIEVHSYNGSLLWEPWQVLKQDQTPYKVFTPFYRKGCLKTTLPRETLSKPRNLTVIKDNNDSIESLGLLPDIAWDEQLVPHWEIGEKGAQKKLKQFLEHGLHDYKEGRNFPAKPNVSRLSPHLHFGEISPNQVWYGALGYEADKNVDCFCSELGWREFSYYLLYHFPSIIEDNLQAKFDKFPWKKSKKDLKAWQKGQTGYPIVDAGMRQLWQTGYIHNRVRMIVGSFLVKNLLLHWHEGEAWFWDCLVDADLASNTASWQWVAGSGADAAPYFRIFNPVLQGQKFDGDGEYTKHFVPELKNLPNKYLFNPWEAPEDVLAKAGVELGKTYPKPIVDVKSSRDAALAAYDKIK